MDISIIIPAYNEEKNIVPICEEVIESLDKMDVIYEIVLVDDGSSDNTFDAMSVAKNTYDNIEIVKFKNGSYALLGYSKNDDKMFKLISELNLEKMEKKYGKAKKYRK